MKLAINAVLTAAVLCIPVLSFAQQTNGPVTRAQVKADLVRVECAGYNPARNSLYYPSDIQAAEAKIHAHSGAENGSGGVEKCTGINSWSGNEQASKN